VYTAKDKPDAVQQWRAERANYPQSNTQTPEKK
jgi:hypothetical protein